MKRLNHIIIPALFLVACALSSCSKDEINYIDTNVPVDTYLYADISSYTFVADGENSISIKIDSSSDWEVTKDEEAAWITASANGNTLNIEVEANEDPSVRSTVLVLKNSQNSSKNITICQNIDASYMNDDYMYMTFAGSSIVTSAQGKYLAYVTNAYVGDLSYYTPIVINLETYEIITHETSTSSQDVICISDTGTLGVSFVSEVTGGLYYIDGTKKMLKESGYSMTGVCAISSDGSKYAGWVYKGYPVSKYFPVVWNNDVMEVWDVPATSIFGTPTTNGAMIRGGDKNLNLMYGSDWTDYSPMIWQNNSCLQWGAETVETLNVKYDMYFWGQFIGTFDIDVTSGPIMYNENRDMSLNGKYLTTTYSHWNKKSDGYGEENKYPIVYNTQDQTCTIIWDMPNYGGQHITNDGILFAMTQDGTRTGGAYDMNTDKAYISTKWISDNYGMTIPEGSFVTFVSEDGKTITGTAFRVAGSIPFFLHWIYKKK